MCSDFDSFNIGMCKEYEKHSQFAGWTQCASCYDYHTLVHETVLYNFNVDEPGLFFHTLVWENGLQGFARLAACVPRVTLDNCIRQEISTPMDHANNPISSGTIPVVTGPYPVVNEICTLCETGFEPNDQGLCEPTPIEDCKVQDKVTGLCLECEEGCFVAANGHMCMRCDIQKCDECEVAMNSLYMAEPYTTCTGCENGYYLVKEFMHGDHSKPRLVCDWTFDRRRDLHCLVSDLDDEDNCHSCSPGRFFNEFSSKCDLCSTSIEGCSECDHNGRVCNACEAGFELRDGTCLQTNCLPHQYQEGSKCINCADEVENCGQCVKVGGEVQCVSCLNNMNFFDERGCGCLSVQYVSVGARVQDTKCESCSDAIDNCLSCSEDGSACNECKNGFFLASEGTCVTDPCKERDGSGHCVSCLSKGDIPLKTQGGTCVLECGKGYTENSIGHCEPEIQCNVKNCAECSSENQCVKCKTGKLCDLSCSASTPIHTESECISECEAHEAISYMSAPGFPAPYCRACSEDCEECVMNKYDLVCNRCPEGLVSFGPKCLSECPEGHIERFGACSKILR